MLNDPSDLPGTLADHPAPLPLPALDGRGAANRRELERDLRDAVAAGAFHLHWQPVVHCLTGRLHRFEALVRWDRPGTGPVSPSVFVPIAEALGLHRDLDLWVLRHAMQEAARWPASLPASPVNLHGGIHDGGGGPAITPIITPAGAAVNVSALWFSGEELSHAVEGLLAETGLAPGRLELEVTERVFIADEAAAGREFAQFRALGIGVSLDDFGTGYSSLGYLRSVAFGKLKLDRTFIEGLGTCRRTEVITRAVLEMAAGLGMTVCAEGVAHQAQLDILQAYGCDEAQGYLIGRPGPLTPARMAAHQRLDRSSLFQGPAALGLPGGERAMGALQ